jgi:hypothetical protein
MISNTIQPKPPLDAIRRRLRYTELIATISRPNR